MSNIYTSVSSNYIQRNGFVMVSNLIMEFQHELEITDLELAFIIKIMKNRPGFAIHDKDLDSTVSAKTLARRRLSLKEKGLLNFSTIKRQDPDTGFFSTSGISYDLSPLEEKLQAISDEIENKKQKEAKKIIQKENLIVEETEEDSPLEKYKKDWENYYGRTYRLTSEEIKYYNGLTEKEKKCIGRIFEYAEANDLLGKYVPRLNLFFKVKFRFNDLFNFCEENINEPYVETELERDLRISGEYTEELYKKIGIKNYAFKCKIQKIVNKHMKDGQIIELDEIQKEIDSIIDGENI